MANHIKDYDGILYRFKDVNLILLREKLIFGMQYMFIVGCMCNSNGTRPYLAKVDAIQRMKKTCTSVTEVQRFLGVCVFYIIWIPHYAHVVDSLYQFY